MEKKKNENKWFEHVRSKTYKVIMFVWNRLNKAIPNLILLYNYYDFIEYKKLNNVEYSKEYTEKLTKNDNRRKIFSQNKYIINNNMLIASDLVIMNCTCC